MSSISLKDRRLALGLSQQKLAKGIGVSHYNLAFWENRAKFLSPETARLFSNYFKCGEDELGIPVKRVPANPIRDKRKELGLTRKQLAEKTGISKYSIKSWESGKASPSDKNLLRLTKLFQCSPSDLGLREPDISPLRRARLELGIPLVEVGRRLGVSYSAAGAWERGICRPHDKRLPLLSNLYRRPAIELGFSPQAVSLFTPAERNALVEGHLDLIPKLIRKNWPLIAAARISCEDLRQDLTIRAIRAVETYRPDKGSLRSHLWTALQWEIQKRAREVNRHGIKGAPQGFRASFTSIEALSEAGVQFSTDDNLFL